MAEQKVLGMRKVIVCDSEKCNGCQLCEYACSISKEKTTNPRLSRIRSVRIEPTFNMAVACRKCEDPPCKDACPRDAISVDEKIGIPKIDKNKCDGCGWCVMACDFGAIRLNVNDRTMVVCDFCDDNPKCVEFCPTKALKYETIDATGAGLSKKAVNRIVAELQEAAKKD